ncbi:hypothetical protein JXA84_02550, partial [candidate division WOR-3 bacterium]|nr:hypothetical protein [candidate division WOR-3 bacterium]
LKTGSISKEMKSYFEKINEIRFEQKGISDSMNSIYGKMETLSGYMEMFKRERSSMFETKNIISDDLAEITEMLKQIRLENEKLKKESEDIRSETAKLRNKYNSEKESYQLSQKNIAVLKEEIDILGKKKRSTLDELNLIEKSINGAKDNNTKLLFTISETMNKKKEIEKGVEEGMRSLSKIKKQNEYLTLQKTKLENDCEELNKYRKNLESKVPSESIKEFEDSDRRRFEETIENLKNQNSILSEELSDLRSKIESYPDVQTSKDYEPITFGDAETAQSDIGEIKKKVSELTQTVENLEKRKKELENYLTEKNNAKKKKSGQDVFIDEDKTINFSL